jgi:HK97 family phage prohead protease
MTDLFERKSQPVFECKGYDPKTRRFKALATKEVVDRDDEIVRVSAFKGRLASFMENPVLAYNHDVLSRPPIGKVLNIDIVGDEMPFEGELREPEVSEFQRDINSAVEGGFLKFFSIQFRALKVEPGGTDSNGRKARRTITEAELFEVSLVTIPANTEAVMKMASMLKVITGAGLTVEEKVKTLFGTPSELDVLHKAREIVARLDTDQRKGLVLPEELAKEAEALALDLWTRGEQLTEERKLADAIDGLAAAFN